MNPRKDINETNDQKLKLNILKNFRQIKLTNRRCTNKCRSSSLCCCDISGESTLIKNENYCNQNRSLFKILKDHLPGKNTFRVHRLKKKVKCYDTFDEAADNLSKKSASEGVSSVPSDQLTSICDTPSAIWPQILTPNLQLNLEEINVHTASCDTGDEDILPPVPPRFRLCSPVDIIDKLGEMHLGSSQNFQKCLLQSSTRNLAKEIFSLAHYGWYWGPISREEAEDKLKDEPDGAFLVRHSSADKYLLSLSFRSSGRTLHTRIEHSQGKFCFFKTEGFSTLPELINYSLEYSKARVFCYSTSGSPTQPSFPVRLLKPMSRFSQLRSLQYLCRFVIRQYIRVDNIDKLPLPDPVKCYIKEGQF